MAHCMRVSSACRNSQGCGCWLSKIVWCPTLLSGPIVLTNSHSFDAGNLFFQVHYFLLFISPIYMYSSSSLPGFIKRCLCFLIASTSFSSFQEWTINLSVIKSVFPEEDCCWRWICYPTYFLLLRNWSFFHGGWGPVLCAWLYSGRPFTDLPSFHSIVSLSLADPIYTD